MKARILGAAAALFLVVGAPVAAEAQNAYATGNVNMRAGPGTRYPVITTVRRGSAVTIHGCLSGWTWCDTSWRGARGWVSGRYLEAIYQGRRVYVPNYGASVGLPIIGFQFGTYWDRYYRDRPFYRDRDRWRDGWHGPTRTYRFRPDHDRHDRPDRDHGRYDRPGRDHDRYDRPGRDRDRADRDRGPRWDNDRDRGDRRDRRDRRRIERQRDAADCWMRQGQLVCR